MCRFCTHTVFVSMSLAEIESHLMFARVKLTSRAGQEFPHLITGRDATADSAREV
jgi:hypothetical protein